MLLVHFRGLPVREPDPWRGSRADQCARDTIAKINGAK